MGITEIATLTGEIGALLDLKQLTLNNNSSIIKRG